MKLGVVVCAGCSRERLLSAFRVIEHCGVEPACVVVEMREAGRLFASTARPAIPVWVLCRDAQEDKTVLLPLGKRGLRVSRLCRACRKKRLLRFHGMLLTGQGVRESELLCLLHGMGCGRYLFLGRGWGAAGHPRCLVWELPCQPDPDAVRRMEGQLCDLCYFSGD